MRNIRLVCLLVGSFALVFGQQAAVSTSASVRKDFVHQVDPGQMYQRVYAIVPMVGSGKWNDPRRPMFAPVPPQAPVTAVHSGIIAFQMWPSDDGKSALVEFVGATPQDLQPIVNAASASVQVFERGKYTQAQIEAAFQQYKKGFTFEWFTARAQ